MKNIGNKSRFFYFLCGLISLVSGLRYHIGSDTANYMNYFIEVPTISNILTSVDFDDLSQPLWFLLNSICKTVVDDFILVQLVHSFAVNLLVGRFIYKTCSKPFLALLAYLCCAWANFNFEIMRESLCIAIYLNLLYDCYIKNNNIRRFLLYSIPLMFIHHFAFIPLLLTFILYYIKYNRLLYFGLLLSIVLYLTLSEDMVIQFILLFGGVLDSETMSIATDYIESDKYGMMNASLIGIAFAFLTKILYSFVVSKDKRIDPLIAKLLLMYGLIAILRLKLFIITRFLNYWQIILIVYSINYYILHKKQILALYVKLCFVYNIYLGIDSFLTPLDFDNSKYDCRYVPYSSYLDKTTNPIRETYFY
ncbi:MAG: EpsG family protein [Alistipes sp.]|nr:EpsG family protein [Alistipes sp.]